jgi:hypothetical protein
MDEITIESDNDMLFNHLSKQFPEVKFYRWCNSTVDFLEFIIDTDNGDYIKNAIDKAIDGVGSRIISYNRSENRMSIMMACRCNVHNSTIRMVESESCMWKAPVSYYNGKEQITIYSPDSSYANRVYDKLSEAGPAEIVEKKSMRIYGFINSFNISLDDLFGELTEKQMDSMIKAIDSGYFIFPRKVHLENIAKAMNLSRSTYQEHLSVALERIMSKIGPLLSLYSSTVDISETE